ncbi:unnamed protein product [Schistosoma margrebowiei]|uniref:Uncharacterized protein n=1 Tax=Schistosoma margrebowiei TaxID=48269 RepID=A0A183ME41_9TREM|nr:unnamed protein product [Schistosoma margrebowiei]
MVVAGSRQETTDLDFVLHGTRQQGVPVILRKLVLNDGFHPVSPRFTYFDKFDQLQELSPVILMNRPQRQYLMKNNKRRENNNNDNNKSNIDDCSNVYS